MDISTLGTVVGIVAICYVIGLGCKAYEKIPDKWIPVIMAVCGGVLGVAGLYTMPDFPAGDLSFLLDIPAIRSFKPISQHGPQSQPGTIRIKKGDEGLKLELAFDFL